MKNRHISNLYQRALQWCKTNPQMKIGVFIFTMVLWFFVILNNRYTYTFSARLELRNIPENRIIRKRVPGRIQANFSGKGVDLLYLLFSQRSGLRFLVDVSSIRRQTTSILLDDYFRRNEDYIIIPRGLDIKFEHIVWPESLRVELDIRKTVKLPVVPDLEVELAPGYILIGSPTTIPDSVTVTGPNGAVGQYTTVSTEKVVLKNVNKPIEMEVRLLSPEGENVLLETQKVRLSQSVDQLSERTLTNVPVMIVGNIGGARIEAQPPTVALTLTGGLSILRRLKPEDVSVFIDMKEWRSNQSYYTPHITLPEGVLSYSQLNPENIEIRVIRERF